MFLCQRLGGADEFRGAPGPPPKGLAPELALDQEKTRSPTASKSTLDVLVLHRLHCMVHLRESYTNP